MKDFIPLFEGFLTYGGMSVREMEAMTVGLEETMDETVISQGPQFIEFMAAELQKRGVPVVTPAGGLGCHINARNRDLVGGLNFVEEPKTLRFFFGRLEPIGDWQEKLVSKFRKDIGDSL